MVLATERPQVTTETAVEEPTLIGELRIRLPDCWATTDEAFEQLDELNPAWDFELSEEGELIVMAGESPESSARGMEIGVDVGIWNRSTGRGTVYGPALRTRPDELSLRMPDVAWISNERYEQRDHENRGSLTVCPELIVEVVSPTDRLDEQQAKMDYWIARGALLGWLIDPFTRRVWVYRPDQAAQLLEEPESLDGEDVCEGLTVSLTRIWESTEGNSNV